MICAAFAAISRPVVASDFRIAAFGDSLTAGKGLAAEEAFPAQLEKVLRGRGHNVTVINAGVSGDTTAGGRARLDWLLADKPDLVILELGANDGLRAIDPQATRENLDAILTRLGEEKIAVLLTGMKAPPNLGEKYVTAFESVYPDLAQKHGVALFPFFLEGVAAEPHLNQGDGLHPTADGVLVIIKNILPYLEPLLKK